MTDPSYTGRGTKAAANSSGKFQCGVFDRAAEASVPLNKQQMATRRFQTGLEREPGLKTNHARFIDSRHNNVYRHRTNIFRDPFQETQFSMMLPQSPQINTRHGMTPYTYSTTWISHPDPDTSLAPKPVDMWTRSLFDTSVKDEEFARKNAHLNSVIDSKRFSGAKHNEYVEECDRTIKLRDRGNLEGIRRQRKQYADAVEERIRHEGIRFF